MTFHTEPENVVLHETGWFDLPSGVGAITKLPLWDKEHNVAARLGHGPGSMWLSKWGARHPNKAHFDEMHRHALFINPYTLPTSNMCKAAGVDIQDVKAVDRYRNANMMGLPWVKRHDGEVFRRLLEANWGTEPVSNFGKHWIDPLGAIYGWYLHKGDIYKTIQGSSFFHKREKLYVDYATTTHAFSPGGPVFRWADGLNLEALTLGERFCAWAGFQSARGIKEIVGPKDNEQILAYSRHCRRGGTFLGVDQWGNALWDSAGFDLHLTHDEDPWCAAFASEGTRCSLLPGEKPPHGLRVSVRELCEDARKTGSLLERGNPGYPDPRPGWLAISGRLGENPLHGGRGHVRAYVSADTQRGFYQGIGGNEGNQVGVGPRPLDDVLAWIVR